jgi:hypothetical protein
MLHAYDTIRMSMTVMYHATNNSSMAWTLFVLILYKLIFFLWHGICRGTIDVSVVTYLSGLGSLIEHLYFMNV